MFEDNYKLERNGDLFRIQHWVSESEFLAMSRDVARNRFKRTHNQQPIESSDAVMDFIRDIISTRENEAFGVLFLDTRHRVIKYDDELFKGTIDGCAVFPRIVVQQVLMHNAAAIVITHQHPSGLAEPSQADISLTHRIRDALSLVDVRLLDHLVVGGEDVVSLSKRGLM